MQRYILIINENINIDSIMFELQKEKFIIKEIMREINCIFGECEINCIENIKKINGILELNEDGIVYAL